MTTDINIPALENTTEPTKTWTEFLHDLTAVDNWIVQRAVEIVEERVIKRGPALSSPKDVAQYLRLKLGNQEREVFSVIFLDSQHRVIAYEALFFGTIDQTSVYPRAIVQRAMSLNAAAMILAHNHPSGTAEPSEADRKLTSHLKQILEPIDVRLLDHFIVGEEVISFAERGLLP